MLYHIISCYIIYHVISCHIMLYHIIVYQYVVFYMLYIYIYILMWEPIANASLRIMKGHAYFSTRDCKTLRRD